MKAAQAMKRSQNINLVNKVIQLVENKVISITDVPYHNDDINKLSSVLAKDITPTQTVLWTIIFVHNIDDRKPTIATIAKQLSVKPIEALAFLPDVEQLSKKKLISIQKPRPSDSRTNMTFLVPALITDRIIYGRERSQLKEADKDVFSLLGVIQEYLEDLDSRIITHDDLCVRINDLTEEFKNLEFVKHLSTYKHFTNEEMLVVVRLCVYAQYNRSIELNELVTEVTDQPHLMMRLKKSIIHGTSKLIQENIVKLENSDFRSEGRVQLTNEIIGKFFGKDAELLMLKGVETTSLIKPESLSQQDLFFNKKFETKLGVVYELLQQDTYVRIQKQMADDHHVKGVTLLFHGPPGTGKTCTAYQIALKTGRALFPVQVTDFKSPYHGESESKLKDIFVKYEKLVKSSSIAPLMLLNEADSVLSTRVSVLRSIDQTLNSLQNLLLEFFETTSGIIICTLNNSSNLDKAFSRRFLIKLLFEKADADTKTKMWRSKLPKLTAAEAMSLAERYDLSGGELDNISRKATIQKLVYNKPVTITDIESFCEEEKLDNTDRPKLGFNK